MENLGIISIDTIASIGTTTFGSATIIIPPPFGLLGFFFYSQTTGYMSLTLLLRQDGLIHTNVPITTRVQLLEPSFQIGPTMTESSKSQFLYGYTNHRDYFVYSANNGQRLGKESFYDLINLSESDMRLVTTLVENKAWDIANALNLNQ